MNKIKIALVEDQHLFRNGMQALLKEVPDFEVLTSTDSGKVFLEQLAASNQMPDVVLADMNMPEMSGVDLTGILQQKYPDIKIIILTVYNQERFIHKMVEAGVAGYLVKNCETEEVIQAIRTAHKTGFYFNDATLAAVRKGFKEKNRQPLSVTGLPVELTQREIDVLKLICMEFTNAEIAKQLYISVRTVDGHRNNLLAKTGSKNTAGLVLFAVNNEIYRSEPF